MATEFTVETGVHVQPMNDQERETNLGNTKMQIQPQPKIKKAAVVYYLTRNGQHEHPHFIEVPLSSYEGLYLRDVINTLNILRGQGMASMFSWASKRKYKNAFLWQDLSDDELIHPSLDEDYVLKGSLIIDPSLSCRSSDSISSSSSYSRRSSETNFSSDGEDSNSLLTRRKNHSFSSIDDTINEHKIYEVFTAGELSKKGSDMSTQTDNNQKVKMQIEEAKPEGVINTTKLKQKEVSAPTNYKSTEVYRSASGTKNTYQKIGRGNSKAKMKNSKVLMNLIGCGCGSKRFKNFDWTEDRY